MKKEEKRRGRTVVYSVNLCELSGFGRVSIL